MGGRGENSNFEQDNKLNRNLFHGKNTSAVWQANRQTRRSNLALPPGIGEFRRSIIPDRDDYQDDFRPYLLVNIELNVVRTPVVWFRADLVMLPATGMDPMNDPNMLHMPSAIISWDASTTFAPPAHMHKT